MTLLKFPRLTPFLDCEGKEEALIFSLTLFVFFSKSFLMGCSAARKNVTPESESSLGILQVLHIAISNFFC